MSPNSANIIIWASSAAQEQVKAQETNPNIIVCSEKTKSISIVSEIHHSSGVGGKSNPLKLSKSKLGFSFSIAL